ncbi:MAG: type VI secretion system ImpA family N-terminal domain-containing protein [Phyllobacteriaceae bacterium]|nr:type VI secretion system ImpA family N-terminal domain-containing protein [Phyllobacteriaceae bacterium]
MKPEFLLSPVNDEKPCGPDLDAAGDNAYFDYMLTAEARLPTRFVDAVKGELFDRQSIDLASETKAVSALLERSRDLRLLVLLARFEAVTGDIVAFADTLDAMASLLETYWTDVHPNADSGDLTMRQVALEMLDDAATIAMPIAYAPLFKDRRIGAVSLHTNQLASGKVAALANETAFSSGDVIEALSRDDNAAAIVAVHERTSRATAGLKRIRSQFLDHSEYDYAPSFDRSLETLQALASMLAAHCPALAGTAPVAPAGAEDPQTGSGATPMSSDSAPLAATVAAPTGPVRSPADVRAALAAVERYFAGVEPSSPVLILVRQTSRLYGRPLVEALGELLPGGADSAAIAFDAKSGFRIDMGKMRALSAEIDVAANREPELAGTFAVASRGEALSAMLAIEHYVRFAEPSSPTPVLLARARAFLDKDFAAVVRDLLGGAEAK